MNQDNLDKLTNKHYSKCMLENVEGWCNHRPLLYLALEFTKNNKDPILELGCGNGSTNQLHQYIENDDRTLISFDTDKKWLDTFIHLQSKKHQFVYKKDEEITDWLTNLDTFFSVCLVDHAPGERRHKDISLLRDKCDIIVIHDSEPEATGYMLDKIWHLFKYRLDIKRNGAWASMVSNKYDFSAYNNTIISNYTLTL